jgi:hypothetical protein
VEEIDDEENTLFTTPTHRGRCINGFTTDDNFSIIIVWNTVFLLPEDNIPVANTTHLPPLDSRVEEIDDEENTLFTTPTQAEKGSVGVAIIGSGEEESCLSLSDGEGIEVVRALGDGVQRGVGSPVIIANTTHLPPLDSRVEEIDDEENTLFTTWVVLAIMTGEPTPLCEIGGGASMVSPPMIISLS